MIENWIDNLCCDEIAHFSDPSWQRLRPLSISTISALAPRISSEARRTGVHCCVVGGGAVMLHLNACSYHGAPARASLDLDWAADGQVRRPQEGDALFAGGYSYWVPSPEDPDGEVRIDWIVRTDCWRALYWHTIATAVDLGLGFRVASADHVVATKLAMSRHRCAVRPKDVADIRLLVHAGLAKEDHVLRILERAMPGSQRELRPFFHSVLE